MYVYIDFKHSYFIIFRIDDKIVLWNYLYDKDDIHWILSEMKYIYVYQNIRFYKDFLKMNNYYSRYILNKQIISYIPRRIFSINRNKDGNPIRKVINNEYSYVDVIMDEKIYIKLRHTNIWICNRGYAFTIIYLPDYNITKRIAIHRYVFNHIYKYKDFDKRLIYPDYVIDHANRNKLDNRISNLRAATFAENSYNQKIYKLPKSGYTGVYENISGKYSVVVQAGEKRYNATFKNKIAAAMARDIYAVKYHGEFAVLNFPEKKESYKYLHGIQLELFIESLKEKRRNENF